VFGLGQGYSGYFLPFLLPATCPQCFATRGGRVTSRSGEAGGEERQKVSTLFEGTNWTNSGKSLASLFPPLGGIVLSQSRLEAEKNKKSKKSC